MRIALRQIAQLHQRQHLLHPLADLPGRQLLHFQAEGHVAFHRHIGKQRIALEHHADAALLRRQRHQILALQQNVPAVDRSQAGQAAQQRRFAAAARPQQGDELPLFGGEIDILKHLSLAIVFVQAGDVEISHRVNPCFYSAGSPAR